MSADETAERSAVAVSKTTPPRSRRSRGEVTIFGTWCKGCGLCIEFCPQSVLEANGEGRTIVAHPERCTACHWCEAHCPDMAITVRRLEPDEIEAEGPGNAAGEAMPGETAGGGTL